MGVASSFVRLSGIVWDWENIKIRKKNIIKKQEIKLWCRRNSDLRNIYILFFIICSIVIIEYSMRKVTESNPNWILSKRQQTLFSINEMRNNDKIITIFGFTFAEWMQANGKKLGTISVMLVIVEILAIHEKLIILSWNWSDTDIFNLLNILFNLKYLMSSYYNNTCVKTNFRNLGHFATILSSISDICRKIREF